MDVPWIFLVKADRYGTDLNPATRTLKRNKSEETTRTRTRTAMTARLRTKHLTTATTILKIVKFSPSRRIIVMEVKDVRCYLFVLPESHTAVE